MTIKMSAKSIYRSNQHASSKLRTVRSLAHLGRWADDLGVDMKVGSRDIIFVIQEIMEAERKSGDLGTTFDSMECQGWAAKEIVRAIEPERKGQWTPWGTL